MIQFGVQHEHLSIDESMVPYFGRHSCKQFIRGKPIRFGYKLWCICSSSGMPYKVVIYEGKTGNCEGPLGTRVVLDLVSICEDPKRHHIYMDNFFSSYNLFMKLKELHFRATGTIKENRLNGCTIINKITMKKKERGTFDYRSQGSLEVVCWNDNAVVTLISNTIGVNPLGKVKRRVKGRGEVSVNQPFVVKAYNNGMGGVDLFDRALSDYRPSIMGKKWYWTLFVNALNISVVFTWRLYELLHDEKVPQKDFRMKLLEVMVKRSEARKPINKPGPSYKPVDDVHFDSINH